MKITGIKALWLVRNVSVKLGTFLGATRYVIITLAVVRSAHNFQQVPVSCVTISYI